MQIFWEKARELPLLNQLDEKNLTDDCTVMSIVKKYSV